MRYTKKEIYDVIDIIGAETFTNHILGIRSEAVIVAMQLSHDANSLSTKDVEIIKSIMK